MPMRFQTHAGEPVRQHFLDFLYQPVGNGQVTGVLVQGIDATGRVTAAARLESCVHGSEEFEPLSLALPARLQVLTWPAEIGVLVLD